jgi:hypothetical protein
MLFYEDAMDQKKRRRAALYQHDDIQDPPREKPPQTSPIFISDKVTLDVSREKDGKSGRSTLRSDASKADLRREVPAQRCPAVTCNVS